MAETLMRWLSERLKADIEWDAGKFVETTKDGFLVASLLHSYKIIASDEKVFVIRSEEKEFMRSNWIMIAEWLNKVDIRLTVDNLTDIIDGKAEAFPVLLRLLYHLFLFLDKQDRLSFIHRQKLQRSAVCEQVNRDILDNNINEQEETVAQSGPADESLNKWKDAKCRELRRVYDHVRKCNRSSRDADEYKIPVSKSLRNTNLKMKNEFENINKFHKNVSSNKIDHTYAGLSKLNKDTGERYYYGDSAWTQDFLDNLQLKIKNNEENGNLRRHITKSGIASIADQSIVGEECVINLELAKELIKISQFEKHLSTVTLENRLYLKNMARDRELTEKKIEAKREEHMLAFLDNLREEQLYANSDSHIDNEERNQHELHTFLYREKLKVKREKRYEMCKEIVLAIVDYIVKYAEFKTMVGNDEIPEQVVEVWKAILCKFQPVFDDVAKGAVNGLEDEDQSEIETIVHLEEDNRYSFSNEDFIDYHKKRFPWIPSELIPNYEPLNYADLVEYLGSQVLGHVVYNILSVKYPVTKPADRPNFSIAAIVIDVPDKSTVDAMKILLKHKDVTVICWEDAVNYCLNVYKSESVGLDDENYDNISKLVLGKGDNNEATKTIRNMKEKNISRHDNTKYTQTPNAIPEEDLILSLAAQLGRYTYESCAFDRTPTDCLLVAIIFEYIKSLQECEGFCLVNFPQTYDQAIMLEEALTGIDMSDEISLVLDNMDQRNSRQKNSDQYKYLRGSKLVNDPHTNDLEVKFETYFTAYIKLKSTINESQEPCIWDLTEENSTDLERFYAGQGCNYSLYYKTMTKDIVCRICQYIIGDFTLPIKSFDELFGEDVYKNFAFPHRESADKENAYQKSKYSKRPPVSSEDEVPSVIETSPESNYEEIDEVVRGMPGDTNWIYAALPESEMCICNLASVWEDLEKHYIGDMGNICFARRLSMNNMMPYIVYVRQKMNTVITKPCRKQDLISDYQMRYNDDLDEWPANLVDKNKWHGEITNIQSQLYDICDNRKREAQMKLKSIISANWQADEMHNLVNTFISAMQVEVNRSALTFQVFEDFYLDILQKAPSKERVQFKKISFNEVGGESINFSSKSSRSTEDKYVIGLRDAVRIAQEDKANTDECNKYDNTSIELGFNLATNFATELQNSFLASINKLRNASPKEDYVVKLETYCFTKLQKAKRLRLNRTRAYDEWSMGVSGEYNRLHLRLKMLKYKAYRDLSSFQNHVNKLFADIHEEINDAYKSEIQSTDRLCRILQLHVEKEESIRSNIEFEYGLFFFDSTPFQYLQPSSPTSKPERALHIVTELEIRDLVKLRSQFKLCSLDGHILDRKFIYILQDFSVYAKENHSRQYLPQSWSRLDENQVPKFVFNLFGETPHVDWRDFLIYCLRIRFPTMDELLDLRTQFARFDYEHKEIVSKENFMRTHLWYESKLDSQSSKRALRDNIIKIFLFELFECESNLFNYTAFLLAFCKDLDARAGFAKAVSMVVGERIGFDKQAWKEVQSLIAGKQDKFMMKEATRNLIRKRLSAFVDEAIDPPKDSATIEEISNSCIIKSDKRTRKKAKNNDKPLEANDKPLAAASLTKPVDEPRESIAVKPASATDSPVTTENCKVEESFHRVPSTVIVYSVVEQVLRNVLKVCLPWHFKIPSAGNNSIHAKHLDDVIDVLREDTDDAEMYVCKFLQTRFATDLLGAVHKFTQMDVDSISDALMCKSACQCARSSPQRG